MGAERADGRGGGCERLSTPTLPPSHSGMGVSTVTAARILKGQLHHSPGEETRLEMDKFPYVALSKVSPSLPPLSMAERAGGGHLLGLSGLLVGWSALLASLGFHWEMKTAAAASQRF